MVNLNMDTLNGSFNDVADIQVRKKTKKSLRLSEKKQLVIKKREEEVEKKEREEKERKQNEKKEKDEDAVAMDMDEEETDAKAKQKRHWESWAKVDKDAFFEALCEFGKDFDKIFSVMDRKAKGRMKSTKDCEPRNKDQIRYFYYRTWKQISKGITLQPSESKRINHEVYCLICYGELRKKDVSGFGKKDLKKLDELVSTGSTTVRYRGRKIRVKPPTCKFLKKLSDDEEKFGREIESIPEIIDVELYPKSNKAWTTAQCIASNPRIRLPCLPITVKLRSLLRLLQKRFENASSDLLPNSSCIALYPPNDCFKDYTVLRKDNAKDQLPLMKTRQAKMGNGKIDPAFDCKKTGQTQSTCNDERDLVNLPEPIPFSDTTSDNELPSKSINDPSIELLNKSPSPSTNEQLVAPGIDSRDLSSNESTASWESRSAVDIANVNTVDSTGLVEDIDMSLFPVTAVNVGKTDLQACYLKLGRPNIIQMEYDWQEKTQRNENIEASSFNKLMILSQRDLSKIIRPLKVTSLPKVYIGSKNNVITKTLTPKSGPVARPQLGVKTKQVHPSDSVTFLTPSLIPSQSVVLSSGQLVTCQATKPPICVPALTNIVRSPNTRIIQRKAAPRLKMIQPASKTLMAKAVAVNLVPQPAQLVQFGNVPRPSVQLINRECASTSINSANKTPSSSPTMFSIPSTSSLSSPITIWSSPLLDRQQNDQVQVEVIQEGSGHQTSVKRLHPMAVEELEENAKRPRIEASAGEERLHTNFSDVNLDFLASNSNDASKLGCINDTDGVNLTSILSGLTKNLRKNEDTEVVVSQGANPGTANAPNPTCSPSTETSFSITSSLIVSNVVSLTESTSDKTPSTGCSTPSVLLTPVKSATFTPSKQEPTLDTFREPPSSFVSQWFSEDITEISLGGLLDVGHLKDQAKNSDSSQASDISIGTLLNVGDKKKDVVEVSTQSSDISIGTLLGVSQKKEEGKKMVLQTNDISIGSLLGVSNKKDKVKSPTSQYSTTTKSFNSDSLLMKPGGDPVIAFESLMDESSIDYINKFKDLTAKFKANNDQSKNRTTSPSHLGDSNAAVNSSAPSNAKDPTLPVYRSEDSVGLLDDLSFVLPVDSNSGDSVKGFPQI